MLKILNLDFLNKSIGSIEANNENINNLEVKLTKTKFTISFNNNNEIITKKIKKKKNEDTIDIIYVDEDSEEETEEEEKKEEETQEETQEEPQKEEETQEEKQQDEPQEEPQEEKQQEEQEQNTEKITLQQMKEILQEKIEKKNTVDSYYRVIRDIYQHFKPLDMNDLLITKEKEVIEYIEAEYKNNHSTIKNKLCGFYKAYTILNIESKLFKNKIQEYKTKSKIQEDKTKEENKKPAEEGDKILSFFNEELEKLTIKIKEDTNIINRWDTEVQLYCLLTIYLNYGVLRASEILECLITDTDDNNDKINYINVKSKYMVINKHKNDRKGTKSFLLDDKLIHILKIGLGKYLITNEEGKLFKCSSTFSKFFKEKFNDYVVYDLRKAISSKCIAEGDTDKIKKLENIQGHSLDVILKNYNTYSKIQSQKNELKENKEIKEIVIGI
jgi:chemotaxis protein histidine kinase CheA